MLVVIIYNNVYKKLFAKRGGRDGYELTTNILSKAFTNNFAAKFSYLGKQKKKALSELKITKCIIGKYNRRFAYSVNCFLTIL